MDMFQFNEKTWIELNWTEKNSVKLNWTIFLFTLTELNWFMIMCTALKSLNQIESFPKELNMHIWKPLFPMEYHCACRGQGVFILLWFESLVLVVKITSPSKTVPKTMEYSSFGVVGGAGASLIGGVNPSSLTTITPSAAQETNVATTMSGTRRRHRWRC